MVTHKVRWERVDDHVVCSLTRGCNLCQQRLASAWRDASRGKKLVHVMLCVSVRDGEKNFVAAMSVRPEASFVAGCVRLRNTFVAQ